MQALFLGVFLFLTMGAANASESMMAPYLMSHSEFMKLETYQQTALIKEVRSLMMMVEKNQEKNNLNYETGSLQNYRELIGAWMSIANAANDPGRSLTLDCVYGGNISSFHKPPPSWCKNQWPCAAKTGRGIKCNPLLFGVGSDGQPICARADSRATWNCEKEANSVGINLQQVVDYVKAHGKEWDGFKEQFNGFCGRLFSNNWKKDPNYTTCQKMADRMAQIEKQQNVKATTPVAVKVAEVKSLDCTPVVQKRLMRSYDMDKKNNLYDQLITITAESCQRVQNGEKAIEKVNVDQIIQRFGRCTSGSYANGKKLSSKESNQFNKLMEGNLKLHQDMAGGLYYNELNTSFEARFGLPIQDARALFCRRYDSKRGPDLTSLKGDGRQKVRSSSGEVVKSSDGSDVTSGEKFPVEQLALRKALHDCIDHGWRNESAKTVSRNFIPAGCTGEKADEKSGMQKTKAVQ